MPEPIEVRKVPLHTVPTRAKLAKLIDDGVMEAGRVIAVIGKTEGNGGVNDYTRIIADRAFREVLIARGLTPRRSGRCRSSGPAAPTASSARTRQSSPRWRPIRCRADRRAGLTVGFAMSEHLLPEDIGRPMIEGRRRRPSPWRAGITDPKDVHYVQTKTRC